MVIRRIFTLLSEVVNGVINDNYIYDDWQKREGSEIYTYAGLKDIRDLLENNDDKEKYGFEIEKSEIVDRKEYSTYLNSVNDTRVPDTKQFMVLKKVTNY